MDRLRLKRDGRCKQIGGALILSFGLLLPACSGVSTEDYLSGSFLSKPAVNVQAQGPFTVEVQFSVLMRPSGLDNLSSYRITDGNGDELAVENAVPDDTEKVRSVVLTTELQAAGESYNLEVSNITSSLGKRVKGKITGSFIGFNTPSRVLVESPTNIQVVYNQTVSDDGIDTLSNYVITDESSTQLAVTDVVSVEGSDNRIVDIVTAIKSQARNTTST